MEYHGNTSAEGFLDEYLKELSAKLSHSEFAQLSVTEVINKLLDLRNMISNN